MLTAYFISGLGADERAFQNLELPAFIKPVYLSWIMPNEKESLVSYSKRLSEGIDEKEPFILFGLSMGGMVAVEIAKIKSPKKIIIISSISNYHSFPYGMRTAGFLHLYNLIPVSWMKSASLIKRIFMHEPAPVKILIEEMIKESNGEFIKWALGAIANWKNDIVPPNLFHIHGEKDEIFPIKYCHPDVRIPNGTHLMVLTHAREINQILGNLFSSLNKP